MPDTAKDIIAALREPFPEDTIHWRAQTVTKDGTKAMALAYLDARDVRQRLNDVLGPMNWACEHYDCGNGRMGCRLSIRIDGEWLTKTDGAGDTQVEAEKGAFSTALKRAAVAWGIGEYLYDLPAPWVPCESNKENPRSDKYRWKKWAADPWDFVRADEQRPKNAPSRSKAPSRDDFERHAVAIRAAKDAKGVLAYWKQIDFANVPNDWTQHLVEEKDAKLSFLQLETDLAACRNIKELAAFWADPEVQSQIKALPQNWRARLTDQKDSIKADWDNLQGEVDQHFPPETQAAMDNMRAG